MSGKDPQPLIDAVADATRNGVGQMSSAQLDAGWQRLEAALDRGKYPRVPIVAAASRWWLRAGLLAAAVLLLGLGTRAWLRSRPEAPLRYVVEGATLESGEQIRTTAAAPARLRFSDDSEIRVAPATRLVVRAIDAHGSRVALADGALDVQIRHRRGTSWRFDAGPFSVRVVGTSFHLAFEAGRGRLALQMLTGVVEARGPTEDRVVTLRAGEALELFANPAAPAPSPPVPSAAMPLPAPAAEPSPAAVEVAPPLVEPAPPHAGPAPNRRRALRAEHGDLAADVEHWGRLIARGEFAVVVKEAERRGIDATLADASAADLASLADAARYLRRTDLARQALLGLRARFPGTTHASDAAFFLGRLAESPSSSAAAAVTWYETYLAESGRGPYAGEALGREMALLARTDRARARKAAETYLERFPQGTQAELARSLLESTSR